MIQLCALILDAQSSACSIRAFLKSYGSWKYWCAIQNIRQIFGDFAWFFEAAYRTGVGFAMPLAGTVSPDLAQIIYVFE